jgi:hypothetical protein
MSNMTRQLAPTAVRMLFPVMASPLTAFYDKTAGPNRILRQRSLATENVVPGFDPSTVFVLDVTNQYGQGFGGQNSPVLQCT